jgi:16S rRNA processing protein RimM
VPFMIAEESVFQKDTNNLVIGLDTIDNPEKALLLIGLTCNLEGEWTDWFESSPEDSDYLIGFDVTDEISGKTGKVVGYEDIPGNPLLEIELDGKKALLPMQTEFVIEIDVSKRKLFLKIPDGLLDL